MSRVANGIFCAASGYGDIKLDLLYGTLVLKDAWYMPDFSCKLVSPMALNRDNILVLLENGVATGLRHGKAIFTATLNYG